MQRSLSDVFATVRRRVRERIANPTYLDSSAVRIDTRSLAVFRIAAGLLIIADIVLRARNFGFFYTDDAAVPQSVARELTTDNAVSVYYLTSDPTVIAALFVVQVLIALQLLVGYRTTVATVLSFLLVVSLDHHNPLVLSYADVLFRLLLFWAIFLPLGERWSVDAVHRDREPRAGVASLASAAILAQIVYMYVLNGYHKRESELWTGGEATPLIMGLDNTTFLLGEFTRNFPILLQYGGLAWYSMLLFAWLLVLLRGRARVLFTAMFVAGHASFAVTVRIGAFAYVAIAGLVLFLQAPFWDDLESLVRSAPVDRTRLESTRNRLERVGRRFPRIDVDASRWDRLRTTASTIALVGAVVSVLVVPTLSALPVAGFVDDDGGPQERIDETAASIGVEQPEWSVFAPHPRTTDRYYVFTAATDDGEPIDVYNERALTYERPHDELQRQYDTYRERFYMNNVRRGGPDDVVSEALAAHLCATWTGEHEDDHDRELTHVNMYVVREDVTLETIDDPGERDREIDLFYAYGCGDNEPREIAPPE